MTRSLFATSLPMKILGGFLVLVGITTIPACVDFHTQMLTFRYDEASDTLRVFQLYEGIESGGAPDDEERQELRSVVCGERTFLFADWIKEFHRAAIARQLEKLNAEVAEAEQARIRRHSNR